MILVGGRSNRFGTDKGLFKFKGKAFISFQLETLAHFNNDIFLVANSKQQIQNYIDEIDIRRLSAFIIDEDHINKISKLRSPMLGLYSAFKELKNLGYPKVFALSCDNPLITYDFIKYMIDQSIAYDCCIPKWNNGFLEPLLAIYPTTKAYKTSLKSLKNNRYKLINIINQNWKINYISIEDKIKKVDPYLQSFKNVNNFEDINQLESIYKKNK
ncbi:MAG: molybdenum cofactor guanylyltransferase [Promethearchaeota archaeon]